MGPLPKRKVSRARRNRRRAHDALSSPNMVRCNECNEFRLAHRVCPHCGSYRGEQVLPPQDD
ncbi:MAG: 50S ribosomal protein L32 [Chloroflexi bacterium]|nr:50S ribosomal protein L32 [Chloroflexota bacterium]